MKNFLRKKKRKEKEKEKRHKVNRPRAIQASPPVVKCFCPADGTAESELFGLFGDSVRGVPFGWDFQFSPPEAFKVRRWRGKKKKKNETVTMKTAFKAKAMEKEE